MAKVVGRGGVVLITAAAVASIESFNIDEAMEPIDNTDLGEQSKVIAAGDLSWSGSITCKWDDADTSGQGAMTIGTSVAVHFEMAGNSSPNDDRTGTALITGRSASVTRGSMVMETFTLQGSGALSHNNIS